MAKSPAVTSQELLEEQGFTLVEDDDVAFSQSLCREVHRIYGDYLDGALAVTESVWAGLSLTLEALSSLCGTVREGVPAVRLEVASAQAREMHRVLFTGLSRLGSLEDPDVQGLRSAVDRGVTLPQRRSAAIRSERGQPNSATSSSRVGSAGPSSGVLDIWLGFWAHRSVGVRLIAGLVGCGLLAVLIDAPLVAMALFPAMWIPIGAASVGVPLAVQQVRRFRAARPRTGTPSIEALAAGIDYCSPLRNLSSSAAISSPEGRSPNSVGEVATSLSC